MIPQNFFNIVKGYCNIVIVIALIFRVFMIMENLKISIYNNIFKNYDLQVWKNNGNEYAYIILN